jgi:hypothetical protein
MLRETADWLMRSLRVSSATGRSPLPSCSTMARRLGVGQGL